MQVGLISATDVQTIAKCLNQLEGDGTTIKTFEIGVHEGNTSRYIRDYVISSGKKNSHFGVDNQQDFKMGSPFEECRFIIGDSVQVCYRLPNDWFDFGFIDANHAYHRVIADYVAYAPKIKVGGILAFHDTNPRIKKYQDYQQVGNKTDERMYIKVRDALIDIGLLGGTAFPEWELLYDIWDLENGASGITAFKKIA